MLLTSCLVCLVITFSGAEPLPPSSTPAPYTMCQYKGQYYNLGQQWQDGPCDNCYCMSTASNTSICQRSCGTYTYVPPQCHLAVPTGKCCQEVTCDFKNKCTYKGQFYAEGEKWNNGCESICKCVNGATGFVQCQARCPTFTSIPGGCQLLAPKSGECCSSIHCDGNPVG